MLCHLGFSVYTWNCFRVFVRPGCAVSASWSSSSFTEVILEEEEEGVSKVNIKGTVS
jgi:hypothetical protein